MTPDREAAATAGYPSWIGFIPVALSYALLAAYQIDLAGVYMDEVNPDYMAVRVLNADAKGVPYWMLPGNLLHGRFPLAVSLYHGMQQLWLGLPVFFLLGTTVSSLRVAHALFALGVLAAAYGVIVRGGCERWLAAAVCIALAIDPTFVYAFRTQSAITMAPAAWLLLSVYSLQRRTKAPLPSRSWALLASGLFLGLAIYGYFVYAFYVPALAVAAVAWRADGESARNTDRLKCLAQWMVGIVLGSIFYILAHSLLAIALSGLRGLVDYIVSTQAALEAFRTQTLPERITYSWLMVEAVFHNWWHHSLIFGEYVPVPAAGWKTALLLAAPALLWGIAELRGRASALLRLLLGLQGSFFVVAALAFGNRLGGHHFVSLVPLSYAALATALSGARWRRGNPSLRRRIVATAFVAALLGINVMGEMQESTRLRETHGVGLYSDAINRFANDLAQADRSDLLFTPDWGLFMPVAFLTSGRFEMITTEDYARARQAACQGRRIVVALIDGDRGARFAQWQQQLGADAPQIRDYRQFDGKLLFQVGVYRVALKAPTCASTATSSPV